VEELMENVLNSIEVIRNCPAKLRGCMAQSELPFFFALVYCIIYTAFNSCAIAVLKAHDLSAR
jgi:hypothetical protein